jgi:hypothetical protein
MLIQIPTVIVEADINYCLSVLIIYYYEWDTIGVKSFVPSCGIKALEGKNIQFYGFLKVLTFSSVISKE